MLLDFFLFAIRFRRNCAETMPLSELYCHYPIRVRLPNSRVLCRHHLMPLPSKRYLDFASLSPKKSSGRDGVLAWLPRGNADPLTEMHS